MKRIVCFHLLNDYSGSPKVLYMVLKGLLERGYKVELVSSRGGVLDGLDRYPGLKRHYYRYAFSGNVAVTMFRYLAAQIYTFFFSFRYLSSRDCVFYINTLLPAGPALAGRIMGKRVVYHYHENAFAKGAFYKALAGAMQHLAHEIICVSSYQASFLKRREDVTVIPNALTDEFIGRLHPDPEAAFRRRNVLMLSSLKEYKGTGGFLELARRLPQFSFTLVINDTEDIIGRCLTDIPENVSVYPRQSDVSRFYNRASLVLNLTDKTKAVETFGMTALEAMSAGLPVIVPTVGGIAEMVEDGVNGFKIDVQEPDRICECISSVFADEKFYFGLSMRALEFSGKFRAKDMVDNIVRVF